MSEEFAYSLVTLLVVPLVLVALGYINEKGFENLISKPIFDKWFKSLKSFQPYLVTVLGIILAYISKQVGMDLVPDMAPYLTASGDVVTVFVGIVIAVLSMAFHKSPQTPVG